MWIDTQAFEVLRKPPEEGIISVNRITAALSSLLVSVGFSARAALGGREQILINFSNDNWNKRAILRIEN